MYNKQVWKDEIPDLARPILDGSGKQKTDPQTGRPLFELVQEGTRITSARLNTMEGGIEAAHTLVEQLARELGGNFVAVIDGVMGLKCNAQGLTATWTAGTAYVGGRRYEVSAGSMPLNPTQGQYLYVDIDGIVKKTTSQVTAKRGVLLFYVATDTSGVISSTDQRVSISIEEIMKKLDTAVTDAALDATAKADAARVSAKTYTDDQVKGIADRLDTEQHQDVVLNAGMQILNAQRRTAFSLSGIKGRTLVNLLGVAGSLDSTQSLGEFQADLSIETTDKLQGSGSLKVTVETGAPNGAGFIGQVKLLSGKYYILVCNIKNISASQGCALTLSGGGVTSGYATDKTKWTTAFFRYAPATNTTTNLDFAIWGTGGEQGLFDAARIYEISKTAYDEIPNMTREQVAAKYPYVDSVQSVRNPYAIRYGENLAPTLFEGTTTNMSIVSAHSALVKSTGSTVVNYSSNLIPVMPNTTYTLQAKIYQNGVERYDQIYVDVLGFDESGKSVLDTIGTAIGSGGTSIGIDTFSTPANVKTMTVRIVSPDSAAISEYVVENITLTHSSTPKPFKPREDTMLALQTDLFADPLTGANADEVFEKDGQYFKLAKWKRLILDGSIDWGMIAPFIGFKRLGFPHKDKLIERSAIGVKYDGKILPEYGNVDTTDKVTVDGLNLYVWVSNTDSGWGDNYTPTPDERKAYFMGWRMYNDEGGPSGVPYNGTGTKVWNSIPGWGTPTYYTKTLPTTPAVGWTPYQLVYQLATPTVEPIVSEGMLTFNEGDNQIEVGTGIVVREKANPRTIEPPTWEINSMYYNLEGSALKNRTEKILAVYKNNAIDSSWVRTTEVPYGKEAVRTRNYDSSASYSVTYLMLDKSPIVPFNGSYAANEKAMLQELTDSVQQNATAVSVLMNKKADKDSFHSWITPTLLNGWVNYGELNFGPAGYCKSDTGEVRLYGIVKDGVGTMDTVLFYLPQGYRPKYHLQFLVTSSAGPLRIDVSSGGAVRLQQAVGAMSYISLNDISFLAEQ